MQIITVKTYITAIGNDELVLSVAANKVITNTIKFIIVPIIAFAVPDIFGNNPIHRAITFGNTKPYRQNNNQIGIITT